MRIAADIVNNNLLIYANQESYGIINGLWSRSIDHRCRRRSMPPIAEVTLNDNLQYGVQFFLKSSNVGAPPILGFDGQHGSSAAATAAAGALLSRVLPGFNFLVGTEARAAGHQCPACGRPRSRFLSNPSLVVVDNQSATLQVGDQIPDHNAICAVGDRASARLVVNNIDYRNTGIILRVAPRINANGNVRF